MFAIDESTVDQVGCIHTTQGLEFDYVGVIVGNDLQFDTEKNCFVTRWENYKDRDGKKSLKDNPEALNKLVRNIYRVLMTRGMKGCYVYFMDSDVKDYFIKRLKKFSPYLKLSDDINYLKAAEP